jgi:peptidoglycan/xylan/chitin deacetylase (PgdA/CDA1 family)
MVVNGVTASSVARKAIKAAVLPAGPLFRRRAGDVVILTYHALGDSAREVDLPVSAFAGQLATLAERETVVTLDQAVTALRSRGAGGVVVTFDDGTRDFHEHALPLLQRYRVPAILYLATGGVAEGAAANGDLTWGHLREAVATGLVSIGSHTHSHADLSKAGEEESAVEMRRAAELVEDRLGVPCRHFAYPWGVASPGAERAARRLFDSAALGWGTNRGGRTDPHRLRRTPVLRNDGPFFFRAKSRGLLDGEALAYRAIGRGPWRNR